jgi:hypothetical protein
MDTLDPRGDWHIIKGMAKKKWPMLTDEDLKFAEADGKEFIERIQKITAETRQTIEKTLKEFSLLEVQPIARSDNSRTDI